MVLQNRYYLSLFLPLYPHYGVAQVFYCYCDFCQILIVVLLKREKWKSVTMHTVAKSMWLTESLLFIQNILNVEIITYPPFATLRSWH